jgi:hypothetical protein
VASNRGELSLAPEEGARLRLLPVETLERRKRRLQVGNDQLEDQLWTREILQPVFPEVLHRGARRQNVVRQLSCGLREQDLPPVGGCADSRCPVDIEAEVALIADHRLPGVDADPHAKLDAARPRLSGEPPLCVHRRCERVPSPREYDEERVALGVDLVTLGVPERGAQEPAVRCQHLAVAIPQLADEHRRALDVGEQEGDGAGRVVAHRSARARESTFGSPRTGSVP